MNLSNRRVLKVVTALAFLAACGSTTAKSATKTVAPATTTASASTAAAATSVPATTAAAVTTVAAPTLKGQITVFAASSLTAVFKDLGAAFTKAHPDTTVTFSFDASSALVTQITQGAPADVFASADTTNMDKLTAASLTAATPVVFATNVLSIIVPAGNPKGIKAPDDLASADLKVVLCDPTVPCGKYAKQSLDAARVAVTPVSLEQNVKGVVTKVTTGEADAGVVYVTDVKAAGDKASGVEIPAAVNVVAKYPIASTKSSTHQDIDNAFIAFVSSPEGQAILAKAGFGKP
jgi:molybdate transport system substrate-binding protein